MQKFEDFCIPKSNKSIYKYLFLVEHQDSDETFDEFLTSLKKLCSTWNFGELRESLIHDRNVIGIKN